MKKILITTLTLAFLSFCSKPDEKPAFAKLTLKIGEVLVNSSDAPLGTRILSKDVLQVGPRSSAVVHFSNNAVLTLKANTIIEMVSILKKKDGTSRIAMNQKQGVSFSKVLKGGANYKIKTPTMVAGVRGTSFSLAFDPKEKKTHTRLLDGKLVVGKADASTDLEAPIKEELVLDGQEKVTLAEETLSQDKPLVAEKLEKEEVTEMKKINKIPLLTVAQAEKIEKLEASASDESNVEKEIEAILPDKKKIEEEIKLIAEENDKTTLESLKEEFGKLSKVTMKDGSSLIGGFYQSGKIMTVTTVNGIQKIKSASVAKVEEVN